MANFEITETIVSKTNGYYNSYLVKDKVTAYHYLVILSTFDNCQIWTMGAFYGLFASTTRAYENALEYLAEIRSLCKICKKLC